MLMLFALFFALLPAVVFSAPPKQFLARYETIGPNWNLTSSFISIASSISPAASISTASLISAASAPTLSSKITQSPYPILGSGTNPGGHPRPTGKGPPTNDTCGGCTVNVPNAAVDWWFAATYEYAVGTLNTLISNVTSASGVPVLTLAPATNSFDVSEAISDYGAYTVTPSAEITSIVSRSAVLPIPSPGTIPVDDVENLSFDPLPASVAVTGASGTVFVATSTTPFVYFSVYEVETQVPVTIDSGRVGCRSYTQTYNLSNPYAYAYTGDGLENQTVASGDIPADFLQQIPQSSCSVGTWQAVVTVLVVVDLIYDRERNHPFIVHMESSMTGLDDSGATSTTLPTDVPTPHIEDSASQNPTTSIPTIHFAPFIQPSVIPSAEASATAVGPGQTTAPALAHIESTVPAGVGGATDTNSIGLATDLPGLISQINSFITAFAHNEATTKGSGQAAATPLEPNGQSGPTANGNGAPSAQAEVSNSPTEVVGTVGSQTIKIGPSSVVVVGTQTLSPGGPAITVGGTPVSLAPSATAIVIGGTTSILPQAVTTAAAPPPVLTIGSTTLTANAATQFFVAPGQTLTPGGAVTVSGTVISLASSASFLVIGGSTQLLPTATPAVTVAPEIVVGGTTFTGNSGSSFVIGGQTLAPGSVITVSGTTISLNPSGGSVIINGNTEPVITQPVTIGPLLTVGNTVYTAISGSSYIIAGQTLTPGGTIIVAGTTISLGPSASYAVINGATETLSGPAALITPPPITIGNGVFTAIPGTGTTYLIGGSALTPGGVITVAGTTISLSPGATAVIVNGVTTTLIPTAPTTNPPLLTIGTATYTALPGGGTTFVIGGQTLTPGGVITVSGTTISLSPSATALIINGGSMTTTETLFPATTTNSASTAKNTGTAAGSASAGATATGSAKPSHGAATTLQSSGSALSIFTFALGYFLSWI